MNNKNSNVEIWVHWVDTRPYWEIPKEERKKAYHVCKMVYTDETRKQYFMWHVANRIAKLLMNES